MLRSYDKKGALPYWAKKHATLDEALNKIAEGNPEFAKNFKAPASKEEFERMYDKYVNNTVDAEVISITSEPKEKKEIPSTKPKPENNQPRDDDFYKDETVATDKFGFDDLPQQQARVRDYVKDVGLSASSPDGSAEGGGATQTTFDEPGSWDEAFKIPSDDEQNIFQDEDDQASGGGNKGGSTSSGGSQKSGGSSGGNSGQKRERQAPLNPGFDDMDKGRAKRKAKNMAKLFVSVFCALTETAFVYFVCREISTERLAELEYEGIIDLDKMFDLGEGNLQTARDFFIEQNLKAHEYSKISEEEKSDLIHALTELLMEKGVVLTPLQEVLLNMGAIVVTKGIIGLPMWFQNRALINQIRVVNVEGTPNPRAAHTHIPPDENAQVVSEEKSSTVGETLGNIAKNMAETFAGSGGENVASQEDLESEIAASNMDLTSNGNASQQQSEESPFSAGQNLGF